MYFKRYSIIFVLPVKYVRPIAIMYSTLLGVLAFLQETVLSIREKHVYFVETLRRDRALICGGFEFVAQLFIRTLALPQERLDVYKKVAAYWAVVSYMHLCPEFCELLQETELELDWLNCTQVETGGSYTCFLS